jgi:anti-sigma factor RsiW
MNHFGRQQWNDYVDGRVGEKVRSLMEAHLYACDRCLDEYMKCVERAAVSNPFSGAGEMTDRIMEMLRRTGERERAATDRGAFYRKLIHYGIAASITLMLMSAGLFQQLLQQTSAWTHAASAKSNASWAERLFDQTWSNVNRNWRQN